MIFAVSRVYDEISSVAEISSYMPRHCMYCFNDPPMLFLHSLICMDCVQHKDLISIYN